MEYISSDTNVWLDFATIDRLELPFKLPFIYLMNEDAAEDELVMGTIGILDRLYDGNYIDDAEFHYCIRELMKHNGGNVRLPVAELKKRMK